jgi:hypothetical protein
VRKIYLPGVCACLCLIVSGCGKDEAPSTAAPASATVASAPAITIDRLEPSSTAETKAFHARPDGQSAIVVFGTAIPYGATVLWNDQPVPSSGGGSFVSGVIAPNLYQTAGAAKVTVRSGNLVSNALEFKTYGKTGSAPQITILAPASAAVGKGFNLQPGGDSALGIAGTDFLPGASLVIDGKKMETVFGRDTLMSAVIPVSLVAHAGSHEVWVTNPDGKTSNKVTFKVGE